MPHENAATRLVPSIYAGSSCTTTGCAWAPHDLHEAVLPPPADTLNPLPHHPNPQIHALPQAGVFYLQNLRPDDGASWVVRETARRVHLFLWHPEAVKEVVPWAEEPYYANADEQVGVC